VPGGQRVLAIPALRGAVRPAGDYVSSRADNKVSSCRNPARAATPTHGAVISASPPGTSDREGLQRVRAASLVTSLGRAKACADPGHQEGPRAKATTALTEAGGAVAGGRNIRGG